MIPAWYMGRAFYICRCGARDERRPDQDQPKTLACWYPGCRETMTQWVPPAVVAERAR